MLIRELSAEAGRAVVSDLAELLVDSVEDGASIGFLIGFDHAAACAWWEGVIRRVEAGETLLLVAEADGRIAGTVQLNLVAYPNGSHRADLSKLLVHTGFRRRGLARALLSAAEKTALAAGRTLLVLDTETDSPAETLYRLEGWIRVGAIPDYAGVPDGSLISTTFYYKSLA